MWETFWVELGKALPQLAVTFFGVFLAFSLDRAIDWNKKRLEKKKLLNDLHDELVEIAGKLTGKGYRLYTDIWDSGISSGQIRLLTSEQLAKLAKIYKIIKGTDYEAMRVRDSAEDYRRLSSGKYMVEDVKQASQKHSLHERWKALTVAHLEREKNLSKEIDILLKEKWWSS